MSTRTEEEYLEAIATIEPSQTPVSTSAIADYLDVSRASVSEMLSRLSQKGLIHYTLRKGATLTDAGQSQVLSLARRHRLWEVFLHQHLRIPWEDVYREACVLEHATSELVTEKLAKYLGDPQACPHGWPIPDSNNDVKESSALAISGISVGQLGRVTHIAKTWEPSLLQHLDSLGLVPGAQFRVLEKSTFDGALSIEVNGQTKPLGAETAGFVMVEEV